MSRRPSVGTPDFLIFLPSDIKIFDRFFRAANARTADPAGTGLGLAIVQKVVEQHHGRIELSSALGQGTMFSLYLNERPT